VLIITEIMNKVEK